MIWVPGQRTGAKFLSPKSLARRVARPSTARSREIPWPAESETAAPSGRTSSYSTRQADEGVSASPARIRSVVPAGRLISPRPTRLSFSVKPAMSSRKARSVVWCAVQVVAFDEESSTPTV